jgi:hypothetical protein
MNTLPQIHTALVFQCNCQETRSDASTSVGTAEHNPEPTPLDGLGQRCGQGGCERRRMTITLRRRA